MITVEEAYKIVLNHHLASKTELIDIALAQGRILAEDIYADRDFPPFDRVTMDGIAIQYNTFQKGIREYPVEGIAPAGAEKVTMSNEGSCIEVMTGAILPKNTDTVIRYEDVGIANGLATINLDALKFRQNIHFQGIDRLKDAVVLKAGTLIGAPELAVLATVGKSKLMVYQTLSIAIISSGDELVDIHETPEPHQIRKSNNYSIKGALKALHCKIHSFHLLDDPEQILSALHNIIEAHEVIIMSGGVSKGKFDFIPEALSALKVKKKFHKIMQRPGKPFWFGVTQNGKPVFALPGNPVSSFMCTHKYVIPWLKKHLHYSNKPQFAILDEDVNFMPDLNYFVQVKLHFHHDGTIHAIPEEGNGSGDFANLTDADAFMELPRGKNLYKKGEAYEIFTFR